MIERIAELLEALSEILEVVRDESLDDLEVREEVALIAAEALEGEE